MKHLKQLALKHVPTFFPQTHSITVPDISCSNSDNLVCFTATGGEHFSRYGIADGSLLLAELYARPKSGDLVVVGTVEDPAVRLYSPDKNPATSHYPLASDTDSILAVILGSFSFFR